MSALHERTGRFAPTRGPGRHRTVPPRAPWWPEAVVYQIYPRSFADANGDGVGDLRGVTDRVPYLAALGIDAVWLSPFYPSPLADGGYDIVDHRDVDPVIGTLQDFDEMVDALHGAGIRVIVDIVPNHTSDQHPDFLAALAAGPGAPERHRYIFRPGRGEGGALPPNDWPSHFGPTCWTRAPDGEWYLHLFAPEQPDLNWDEEDVHRDFERTLSFWADRGVDGFRIDVAHGLAKDLSEPWADITSFDPKLTPLDGSHPLFDRDELMAVYRRWTELLDDYDEPRMTVAEAAVPGARVHRYLTEGGLSQAFNFDLLDTPWDANAFRAAIDRERQASARSGANSTWVLGNHDCVRPASRYGLPVGTDLNAWLLSAGTAPRADLRRGRARALAAAMVLLALPGSTYVYQGEELGLPEVPDLDEALLEDPMWLRSAGAVKGRDGCRVPLPWAPDGPSLGFGPGPGHLPQPASFAGLSVDVQAGDPSSALSFFRRALALRAELLGGRPDFTWLPRHPTAIGFRRGADWLCVLNMGEAAVELPDGEVLLASGALDGSHLPPDTCAWLTVPGG
ncbi:glycoside hydrolase family 13 protein [Oryzobacter sp. R7]|uniref:glycoside hydrolase family 13 protein n=1 Tax=Oryzobacter faecalis TaxID=3388656 RepID=UPI00398D5951